MKITSLLENTTQRRDMKTEHGLSLYIETEKHKILFDMGQTQLFRENAQALGIDLAGVDLAIVSHGHYDHGGGLQAFMEVNDHAPIYIHRDAFLPHYNGIGKYIGLDLSLLRSSQIVFTDDIYPIDDTLQLYSCNHKSLTTPLLPCGLTEKVGAAFLPEDFRHEQYLLISENKKRVLISGCSHKGILNIAHWFAPHAIIGGFHFSKLPLNEDLERRAMELNRFDTDFYTCHCTGEAQYAFMKQHMNRLFYLSTGQAITL